jgi:hypothetical protein
MDARWFFFVLIFFLGYLSFLGHFVLSDDVAIFFGGYISFLGHLLLSDDVAIFFFGLHFLFGTTRVK